MSLTDNRSMFETNKTQRLFEYFRTHGYVVLKDALTPNEVAYFTQLFDNDRAEFGPPNCWHPFDTYQTRNCNALVTSPDFDKLLRHPKILPVVTFLMGGPVCFSEICLRHMAPYDGEPRQSFHRDRPHWENHPLRMDYMQLMLYLTDVDETTHCFSISPESVDNPILDREAQLERDGIVDFHAPCWHSRALQYRSSSHGDDSRDTKRAQNRASILWSSLSSFSERLFRDTAAFLA